MKLRRMLAGVLVAFGLLGGAGLSSATAAPKSAQLEASPAMYVDWDCPDGYFCTARLVNGKVVFNKYYYCQRIYLTNWIGSGWILNWQTPGTVTTFYGKDGKPLSTSVAKHWQRDIDWTPVWSFQVC